jgi:hypothetical protein
LLEPLASSVVETQTYGDYIEPIYAKGTSRRIYGELYKVIDSSDVILHILDARDPLGTMCDSVLDYIKKEKSHKQVILVINKCDLVPNWVTAWLFYLDIVNFEYSRYYKARYIFNTPLSEPSKDTFPNIVPECWLSTGEEMEHRYVDDPSSIPPPPSADFFSKFKAILDKYEIDAIGGCYSPPLLKPEYRYLETLKHDNRSQIINQVVASSIDLATTTPSIWTLMGGCIPGSRCSAVCVNCPPTAIVLVPRHLP